MMINPWTRHGTKILGTISTIVGAIQAADLAVQQLLSNKAHAALSIVMSIVGALTVQRGFENSRKEDPQ